MNSKPRMRQGAYFGSIIGITYPDPEDLGEHHYYGLLEKNGLVYTCKAGFVDLGHLRESADRTKYISELMFKNLMKGDTEFSFRVVEPSVYYVKLEYPKNWKSLTGKEEVAKEVSIRLGQYFAQKTTAWHEIITWFGFKSTGVFSEYVSSFSCEDTYSDLLGTCLAAKALSDPNNTYDEAMTKLINEELQRLDAQPPTIASFATETVQGQDRWFTGGWYFFVNMNKRNFDIGIDDGFITPWLVQDICPESKPEPLAVPNEKFLSDNGFSMDFEIELKEMERGKILSIVQAREGVKTINPKLDFPVLMEYIIAEAKEKLGPEVDNPNW